MNVFAKFDEIPSMILQVIKETKRYGHSDGQCEKSIPSHKHSLREYKDANEIANSEDPDQTAPLGAV